MLKVPALWSQAVMILDREDALIGTQQGDAHFSPD